MTVVLFFVTFVVSIADLTASVATFGSEISNLKSQTSSLLSVVDGNSLNDHSLSWPTWQKWRRTLRFSDYNTQIVVFGTMMLGMAAGVVGSFTLLRRRALMGDALSHATLPGVGLAFIIATHLGLDGKSLPILLIGAAISGIAGVAAILYVRNMTRLKEDAALGIVLSVFFGAGISILTVIQQMSTGNAAGLESFIYGKTASMDMSDAVLIGLSGLFSVLMIGLLFKELTLLCFDEGFAGSRGYPLLLLDVVLMSLVVLVTIIGLQAVGNVLVIALFVMPAAAARFWTPNLKQMTLISAAIGGAGGFVGSIMSALMNLPSGPMIVLVCSSLFFLSMVMGIEKGVLVRFLRRRELNRNVDRQHLLRSLYELMETRGLSTASTSRQTGARFPYAELFSYGSWTSYRLLREIKRCQRAGFLLRNDDASLSLTDSGIAEASRLAHEHRLWEMYLITHADVAPGRVDQSADAIEHVLEPELIARLERLLQQELEGGGIAPSPHPIEPPGDPQ